MGVEIVRPEPLRDRVRARERPFHRDLLVEQHPHQCGERAASQQFVGLRPLR
jgi:hypothetical protein